MFHMIYPDYAVCDSGTLWDFELVSQIDVSYYFLRTVDFIWSRFMLQFNIMPWHFVAKINKISYLQFI